MATKARDKKESDDLLVYGFIRKEDIDIPTEIIALCFLWYHIELFIFKSSSHISLNEDKTLITQQQTEKGERALNSCYGSIIMPSINNPLIYEYTIKVSPTKNQVGIGIDDSECKCIDTYFIGSRDTFNYGLQCWNGHKSSKEDMWGVPYGNACDHAKEIIVVMIYNAKDATLSFSVNGKDYGIAYDNVHKAKGLNYRLALYQNGGSTIELLGYCTKSTV